MMAESTTATASRPTIVTLTINPALDITTSAPRVHPTDEIRCEGARHDPGGGGVNVARIAHVLGAAVSAVVPAGGPPGDVLTDLLADSGIPFRPVRIGRLTRESFTVNEQTTGRQYRFVLPGARFTTGEQAQCLNNIRLIARYAQFVVASGSLPPGVAADYYQRVSDVCRVFNALLVLAT